MSVLYEFSLLPGFDVNFTDAEKDACMPIIGLLYDCNKLARKEGLLAFEKYSKRDGLPYTLEVALALLVDGESKESVKAILKTLIIAGEHSGSALLERLLILEGVLAILEGENPRYMEYYLLSMLGESYLKQGRQARKEKDQKEYAEHIDNRLEQIMATPTDTDDSRGSVFEEMIKRMGDPWVIVRLMSEIDDNMTLALALKGYSDAAVASLLRGVSQSRAKMILDDMRNIGPTSMRLNERAQKRLEDVFEMLQNTGEIPCYREKEEKEDT